MIVFQNSGLLDLDMLRIVGVSVKPSTDSPIGFFGTGLKYAVAVLLRNGCSVGILLGKEYHTLATDSATFRGEAHDVVTLDGVRLPFTLNYGRNWDVWQAYRELYSNAHDEPDASVSKVEDGSEHNFIKDGYTTIVVTGEPIEKAHENRGEIILQTEPLYRLAGVDVHAGESKFVYYQRIRVGKLQHPSVFTYDLRTRQTLTEDRTLAYSWTALSTIARALVQSTSLPLIEKVLSVSDSYLEGSIDYSDVTDTMPSESFVEVAERLRNDEKLGGKSKTLFTAFRDQLRSYGVRDHSIVDPTPAERVIIDYAMKILEDRHVPMAGITVLFRREQGSPSGYDDRITLPAEYLEKSAQELAIALAIGRAHASGPNAAFQLAHLLVVGSLPTREKAESIEEFA